MAVTNGELRAESYRSSSASRIFICYRRGDTAGYAEAVYQALAKRLGSTRVFIDNQSGRAGEDFVRRIESELKAADTVLVMIGELWASPENLLRLNDESDFVRREIKTSLERGARVFPIFVGRAVPPREKDLPAEIQRLARIHGRQLSGLDEDQLYALLDLVTDRRAGVAELSITFGTAGLVAALLAGSFSELTDAVTIPAQDGRSAQIIRFALTPWLRSPVRAFLFYGPLLVTAALLVSRRVRWSVQRGLIAALAGTLAAPAAALVELAIRPALERPGDWAIVLISGLATALRFGLMALLVLLSLRNEIRGKLERSLIERTVLSVLGFSFLSGVLRSMLSHYRGVPLLWPATLIPSETFYYPLVACGLLIGLRGALSWRWRQIAGLTAWLMLGAFVADVVLAVVRTFHPSSLASSMIRGTTLFALLGCALALGLRRAMVKGTAPAIQASME